MTETAVSFGDGGALIGVLTEPAAASAGDALPGAVVLNAGLIHRVGAHRLSVTLARRLAPHGVRTLRFDLSGIGDSRAAQSAPQRYRERWVAETRQAMDWFGRHTGVERFVLFGHCNGASIAYMTAHADERVTGLCLLNPPVPFQLVQYLRTVLLHANGWRRLLGGRLKLGKSPIRFGGARAPGGRAVGHDIPGGLRRLAERGVRLLVVRSEWDRSDAYFERVLRRELAVAPLDERLHSERIPGADHDLTLRAHQARYLDLADRWTLRLCHS